MYKAAIRLALLYFLLLSVSEHWLIHSSYAADELYLTGIVKSIDHANKTVVVDVQSVSCRGGREFTVDHPYQLDEFLGAIISFSIDSSTCADGKVYKLFPGGRRW